MNDISQDKSPNGEASRIVLPDFVDLSQVIAPPILPPFLIGGLLYQGDKILISGPPKAGKSILLLKLAVAVATGTMWLGRPVTKGTVVYVNFEIRDNAFRDRYFRLISALGLTPEKGKLIALNLRGNDCGEGGTDFVDALIEKLVTLETAPSLIIIDPFYKLGAGDENAVGDVHRVLKRIDEVAHVTGASVGIVHHHPKYAQGHKSPIDRASGSGVFGRDFDCIVDLMQLDTSKAIEAEIALREPDHIKQLAPFNRSQALYDFRKNTENNLTAWRVEFVARHTATPPPIEIWYDYPLHRPDETGLLASADYATQSKRQGGTQKNNRVQLLKDTLEKLASEGNNAPTYKELEEETGFDRSTLTRYVEEQLPEYEARKIKGKRAYVIVRISE